MEPDLPLILCRKCKQLNSNGLFCNYCLFKITDDIYNKKTKYSKYKNMNKPNKLFK